MQVNLERPKPFANLNECWRFLYKLTEQLELAFDELPADQSGEIKKMQHNLADVKQIAEAASKAARG